VAFLNLGGVGNVTWVEPLAAAPEAPGALMAFDTGPANALIDDFIAARTGASFDADGATAARGLVSAGVLERLPAFPYLRRPPPKSLDRNDFRPVMDAMAELSTEDGAATLTAFTADCVAESLHHMPSPPARWLVCGGGRKNATMMRMLADRLSAPVEPVEAVGLDGDMLEAQAFAYLAVRMVRGLPTSAPATTGCREPVCGGRISYP
jgi:anhydro-N-acetylmuramic acid kinase